MKDKQIKPAVLPTEIPKKEETPPAPPQPRLIVIEFNAAQAKIVRSDCASGFELKGILQALLISFEKG